MAPNNQWIDLEIEKKKTPFNDAAWNSGFEHATRIDAKNHLWMTEMRIPLSAIKAKSIHPGDDLASEFLSRRRAGRRRAANVSGLEHNSQRRKPFMFRADLEFCASPSDLRSD